MNEKYFWRNKRRIAWDFGFRKYIKRSARFWSNNNLLRWAFAAWPKQSNSFSPLERIKVFNNNHCHQPFVNNEEVRNQLSWLSKEIYRKKQRYSCWLQLISCYIITTTPQYEVVLLLLLKKIMVIINDILSVTTWTGVTSIRHLLALWTVI